MIFLSSFAAYNPSNVYGQNKVEAEELVKKLKNYLIIRPSLVVGESPNTQASKLFNQIVHMITDRSQIKLDSSWKFEATYLRHLAEIIYTAIENSEINQLTIPVVAKGLTSRYQIAQELLFDYEITVEEIDQNRIIPLPELDLSMFEKFDLFTYTYDEIIAEMKKKFVTVSNQKTNHRAIKNARTQNAYGRMGITDLFSHPFRLGQERSGNFD